VRVGAGENLHQGLEGVHITLPHDRSGFIGPSLLLDKFLKPDTRPSSKGRQSRNRHAVAIAPAGLAEIVVRARRVLASKASRITLRERRMRG
jgi:hypothetical protein